VEVPQFGMRAGEFTFILFARTVVITMSFASRACFLALREEFFFPRAVVGPVELLELLRLASTFACEIGFLGEGFPVSSGFGKAFGSSIVPPENSGPSIQLFSYACDYDRLVPPIPETTWPLCIDHM